MDTSNPVFFLFDCIKSAGRTLNSYTFLDVSLTHWFVAFIIVGMVVSVFWRGARG